jgi:hypothetical protein
VFFESKSNSKSIKWILFSEGHEGHIKLGLVLGLVFSFTIRFVIKDSRFRDQSSEGQFIVITFTGSQFHPIYSLQVQVVSRVNCIIILLLLGVNFTNILSLLL